MTRFVAHPTPVGGQLNYAFDEGKDAGGCGMPAKVTSGSAAARLFYPNNAIDARSFTSGEDLLGRSWGRSALWV